MRLSSETAKTVYLVPLSLAPEQSLEWTPAYYRAKLGVSVRILPPLALSAAEQDPARHQYIAEKCIDLIVRSHRDLAADPTSILIGVTSQDIFIRAFDWRYAENYREEGRLAVVSAARLRPTDYPGRWNKELFNSRLQKMLTKNITVLYFNMPLTEDYTSLLSSGVLSGKEVDYMSGQIIGAQGSWVPLFEEGEPMVSVTIAPGKPATWGMAYAGKAIPDTRMEFFMSDLALGELVQRKFDFYFDDEYPLAFSRVFTGADERVRAFGTGAMDSLDILLSGVMESYVDLMLEDGGRIHFTYVKPKPGDTVEVYQAVPGMPFTQAINESDVWRVTSRDGWTYLFPYRPKAQPSQVTVLTGFIDPAGHKYEMIRDDSGDLLRVTTPSGKWLRLEHDELHRIRHITDSQGRSVQYDYNAAGQLARVSDSEGYSESYVYDAKDRMVSVMDGAGNLVIKNEYMPNGFISGQVLADGRHLQFGYTFGSRMVITRNFFTNPSGLLTDFQYFPGGYVESLPTALPHQN